MWGSSEPKEKKSEHWQSLYALRVYVCIVYVPRAVIGSRFTTNKQTVRFQTGASNLSP